MTQDSKLSKYPPAFARILLSLPLDGRELPIPLASNAEAIQTRLQYYNFLKFLDRNRRTYPEFYRDNRAGRVMIRLKGPTLIFSLKGQKAAQSLEAGLDSALQSLDLRPGEVPAPLALDMEIAPEELPQEAQSVNPMEIFLNSQKEQGK